MSVLANLRYESSAEFVNNSRELYLFTIRKCARYPKRYTFYLGQPTVALAEQAYKYACLADFPPQNKKEAHDRHMNLLRARELTRSIARYVGLANDLFGLSDSVNTDWMRYVDLEIRLLDGIIKYNESLFGKF